MSASQSTTPGRTLAPPARDKTAKPVAYTQVVFLPNQTTSLRRDLPLILFLFLVVGCGTDAPKEPGPVPCDREGEAYTVAFRISTKDGVILADGEVDEYETMSVLGDDETKALGFRPDVRGSQGGRCVVDFAVLVVYDPLSESREVFDSSVQLLEGETADIKVPFENSHVALYLLGVRQGKDGRSTNETEES